MPPRHARDRLELRSDRLVAIDLGQPTYAVALQAAVQRRPGQMWDRRLQGIEAVVQRKQRVAPEGHHHGFFLNRQRRGPGLLRAGPQIGRGRPLAPLDDRLLVDPVAPRQRPQALPSTGSGQASLCCIARRTTSVVVALPCRTWPIALPSTRLWMMHHQSSGPNI